MIHSAVLLEDLHREAAAHLLRRDGQEDVTFALWHPSQGRDRRSSIVNELVLPHDGDRLVHGNAEVMPQYVERALAEALARGAGVALMHAHPLGSGWQGMSSDDRDTEASLGPSAFGATGLPLLGMTMAGDETVAARLWVRSGPRRYQRRECESVRVIGQRLQVFFEPRLRPAPTAGRTQVRSVAAWGPTAQAMFARLRVGVVGAGNVGSIVAEILARTGIGDIRLIDFDSLEVLNLDRTLGATRLDVLLARSKVETAARAVRRSAVSRSQRVEAIEFSVAESDGFRAALDCDVLFSCVDRPWPRAVLNLMAYAHAIPVIDGGILVRTIKGERMRGAEWVAQVAAPTRRCLECVGQYDPGLVSAEREGYFDRPSYIAGLPEDHPIKRNENVFIFGVADASLEALQFLSLAVAPGGISNVGAQTYTAAAGCLSSDYSPCLSTCLYSGPDILGRGDHSGLVVTGRHETAEQTRETRRREQRRLPKRILRSGAGIGDRIIELLERRVAN